MGAEVDTCHRHGVAVSGLHRGQTSLLAKPELCLSRGDMAGLGSVAGDEVSVRATPGGTHETGQAGRVSRRTGWVM